MSGEKITPEDVQAVEVVDENEEIKLPEIPAIELNIASTNVTDNAIAALKEKHQHVPTEIKTQEDLKLNKEARADIRGIRVAAGKYATKLKQAIKSLTSEVKDDNASLVKKLLELEDPIDKRIKDEEARLKEERDRKKKEREEKDRLIDKKIDAIKNLPVSSIKESSEFLKFQIDVLSKLEYTEEEFLDRVEEAELAKEISIDTLGEMLVEAKSRESEAEKAKERENEISEQKRVGDINKKISDFDGYIVKAATASTIDELKNILDDAERIEISDVQYEEFSDAAFEKKRKILEVINNLLDAKLEEKKKYDETKANAKKLAQDKIDLEKRENEFEEKQRIEEDNKREPEPEPEPSVAPVDEAYSGGRGGRGGHEVKEDIIDPEYKPVVFSENKLGDKYLLMFECEDEDYDDIQFYSFNDHDYESIVDQLKKGSFCVDFPDTASIMFHKVKSWKIFSELKFAK